MLRFFCFSFFLLLLTQLNASTLTLTQEETNFLNKKQRITMCIDPDWMPLEKIEKGEHIGMSADYFLHFQKVINTPIDLIQTKTWLESLEYGKNKKCDIFSLVMPTPERREYLAFTQPYLSVPLVIATKLDQPFINTIPNVIDKQIGIVKGYAYGELLKVQYPKMQLVEVENVTDGLDQVLNKKLFGFIGTLSTIGYTIQKNYIGELKIAGKFDDKWSLGVGVRNDEPLLKDIFNKAINTITPEQHQNILSKWVSVNYQRAIDYDIIFQISCVFLLVLAFMYYKNRTIKRLNKKMLHQQDLVDKYVLILTTDLQGVITDVNSAYCKATGYTKKELIGNTHSLMRHPEMTQVFFDEMWKSIKNNQSWFGEIKNFKKDKEPIICNLFIEPIFEQDKKVGYISISEDITDKKRIEKISITDKLTGLFNRHKLDEILTMKIEEYLRYKTPFSVILLDIDYFKDVNDNYGHDIGDYVLQQFAVLLKSSVRTTDVIGRWGGEEFIIVCTNTSLENATTLAEHLRKKVESTPFDTVGNKTASFGVKEFEKGDDMISFFKSVDDALYQAKHTGRNKVIAN